jgi:hypothetical protein
MPPILTDIKKAVTAVTQNPLKCEGKSHYRRGPREGTCGIGLQVSIRADRLPQKAEVSLRAIVAITTTLQAVDALPARFDNAGCVE